MALQSYQDLITWQKSMELAELVYRISRDFPSDERFGLTNQVRRASVSIPSNIAEGRGRGRKTEFCQFLRISNGSRQEVETQIILASRLGYMAEEQMNNVMLLTNEIGRLLTGLRKSME